MRVRTLLAVAFGVMLAATSALAHHSFSSEYDASKPVTLTGVVTKVEWLNPHVYFYINVKDESGKIVEWEVEMMSLNHLRSYGWTHNTIKPGDSITCTGGAAKSGALSMISSYMKLADGRSIKS